MFGNSCYPHRGYQRNSSGWFVSSWKRANAEGKRQIQAAKVLISLNEKKKIFYSRSIVCWWTDNEVSHLTLAKNIS